MSDVNESWGEPGKLSTLKKDFLRKLKINNRKRKLSKIKNLIKSKKKI
jgi:hypothetical protein